MIAAALRRLEIAAEELRTSPGVRSRADAIASHVLAVRLLVEAGASDDAVDEVLRRAEALLHEAHRSRVA